MWAIPQECLTKRMYIQARPIPVTGHTLKPLEQQSNLPWLHHMSVLEELRTQKFQEWIKERDSKEPRYSLI